MDRQRLFLGCAGVRCAPAQVYVRTRPLGAGGASGAYRPPREEAVEAGDVLLGSAALDLTLLWLGLDKVNPPPPLLLWLGLLSVLPAQPVLSSFVYGCRRGITNTANEIRPACQRSNVGLYLYP